MKRVLIISLVSLAAVVSGCTKWLDVKDETKKLEGDVYKTEDGIDGALNGLYRELMSNNLYGGNMNGNLVDFMAHYYDFPTVNEQSTRSLYLLGNYDYNNLDIRGQFDAVWNSGYSFILHLNTFIKNMEAIEGMGVLSENNRKLFLGEAYGMRAMMHLDLYRLYGPVAATGTAGVLPYHVNAIIDMPDYSSPKDFLNLVLADLDTASKLMVDTDPMKLENKRFDGANDDAALDSKQRFATMFRNKRMNYWAVQVLKMRANMLFGTTEGWTAANTIGTEVLTSTYGSVFMGTTVSLDNAMAYTEIIMGANKIDENSWWRTYYEQSLVNGNTRVSTQDNIARNLWGNNDLSVEAADKRLDQFKDSGIEKGAIRGMVSDENYKVSHKYRDGTRSGSDVPGLLAYNIRNLKGLIRLSEVEYTVAEARMKLSNGGDKDAVMPIINNVLTRRGLAANTGAAWSPTALMRVGSDTAEEVWKMLKLEWYREFVGEGQAWFYLKRNGETPFAGNSVGLTPGWTESKFVWVRPEGERDFDKKE